MRALAYCPPNPNHPTTHITSIPQLDNNNTHNSRLATPRILSRPKIPRRELPITSCKALPLPMICRPNPFLSSSATYLHNHTLRPSTIAHTIAPPFSMISRCSPILRSTATYLHNNTLCPPTIDHMIAAPLSMINRRSAFSRSSKASLHNYILCPYTIAHMIDLLPTQPKIIHVYD